MKVSVKPLPLVALFFAVVLDQAHGATVTLFPAELGTFSPIKGNSYFEVQDTFGTTCGQDNTCKGSFTLDLSTSETFTVTLTVPNTDTMEIELDPTGGTAEDSRDPGDPLYFQFIADYDPPPANCGTDQKYEFENITSTIQGSNVQGLALAPKQANSYERTLVEINECSLTAKFIIGGGQYTANPPYRFKEISVGVPYNPALVAQGPQTLTYQASMGSYAVVWSFKGVTKLIGPGAPAPAPGPAGGATSAAKRSNYYVPVFLLGLLGAFLTTPAVALPLFAKSNDTRLC